MGRHKGYKMSEEHKRAISEAHKRKHHTPMPNRIISSLISLIR